VASSGAINDEVGGSNEECVVAAGCDFKHQTSPTKDHFKELLKVTDPHHSYTINHKLKDCIMIEKFMTSGAFSKGMKPGRHGRERCGTHSWVSGGHYNLELTQPRSWELYVTT
jgi:hypothetical protein